MNQFISSSTELRPYNLTITSLQNSFMIQLNFHWYLSIEFHPYSIEPSYHGIILLQKHQQWIPLPKEIHYKKVHSIQRVHNFIILVMSKFSFDSLISFCKLNHGEENDIPYQSGFCANFVLHSCQNNLNIILLKSICILCQWWIALMSSCHGLPNTVAHILLQDYIVPHIVNIHPSDREWN